MKLSNFTERTGRRYVVLENRTADYLNASRLASKTVQRQSTGSMTRNAVSRAILGTDDANRQRQGTNN